MSGSSARIMFSAAAVLDFRRTSDSERRLGVAGHRRRAGWRGHYVWGGFDAVEGQDKPAGLLRAM
jgi:hypothetical protein